VSLPARAARRLGRIAKRAAWRPLAPAVRRLFHVLYYDVERLQTWEDTRWMGARVLKNPFDLWSYQEIVHETRPDLVVETGTFNGGSTLYFASLLDCVGGGRVLSVDIEPQDGLPGHPRIEYRRDSSVSDGTLAWVAEACAGAERVMVVLDSDHSRDHVLAEMRAYAGFVTPGCYMVVEDGNVNGHPVFRGHGPGPTEALRAFLREDARFEPDPRRERFLMSFNPGGWLRRR
jgi:cephalosporin hydroxylase